METLELHLPPDLRQAVERKLLAGSGRTLEELVVHLLTRLVESSHEVEAEEEAFLEQRLRSLGYL